MPSNDPLLRVLDRMGCGAVFVDGAGQILSFNQLSADILSEFTSRTLLTDSDIRECFKILITSNGNRFRIDSESWMVIDREERKSLAVYAIPMGDDEDSYKQSLIIIVDLDNKRGPTPEVLRKMFKLSPTESITALQLLEGKTPQEIAEDRRISQWTVRTQLASIFSKTRTRRQSELVFLLLKVSILP